MPGAKRLFREAEPGEKLTLIRQGGDVVFTHERPLALGASASHERDCRTIDPREAHIRALSDLMKGSISSEVEAYLNANEFGLALSELAGEIEEGTS